jgi:hypothetical protein
MRISCQQVIANMKVGEIPGGGGKGGSIRWQ